jgi:antitoxin (DNA-binding transcriptional repressor) of toxin-antitoxin stability system
MATIHISEAEAARDLAGLVDRVRRGDEVAIERDDKVVALLRDADAEFKPRSLKESLAIAEALERERGYPAVMDEDFAADMREIIAMRSQWNPPDCSAT